MENYVLIDKIMQRDYPLKNKYIYSNKMLGGFSLKGLIMGDEPQKSKSTMEVINNQLNVNEDYFSSFSSNTNEAVSNILNVAEKSCSSSTMNSQEQDIKLSGVKAGSINIGGKQTMAVSITAECIQKSELRANMIKEISQQIINDMQNNMNTESKNDIKTRADSKSSTGLGSGLFSPTINDDVNTKIRNDITNVNKNNESLTNIVSNSVISNFTNEDIQKCINDANNKQKQSALIEDSVASNININFDQDLSVQVFNKCIQDNINVNTILDKTATALDLSLTRVKEVSNDTKNESDISTATEAAGIGEAVAVGAEGLGTGLSNVYKGLGEAVSTGSKGLGEGISTGSKGLGEGLSTTSKGLGDGIGSAATGVGKGMSSAMLGLVLPLSVVGVVVVIIIVGILVFMNSSGGKQLMASATQLGSQALNKRGF